MQFTVMLNKVRHLSERSRVRRYVRRQIIEMFRGVYPELAEVLNMTMRFFEFNAPLDHTE